MRRQGSKPRLNDYSLESRGCSWLNTRGDIGWSQRATIFRSRTSDDELKEACLMLTYRFSLWPFIHDHVERHPLVSTIHYSPGEKDTGTPLHRVEIPRFDHHLKPPMYTIPPVHQSTIIPPGEALLALGPTIDWFRRCHLTRRSHAGQLVYLGTVHHSIYVHSTRHILWTISSTRLYS